MESTIISLIKCTKHKKYICIDMKELEKRSDLLKRSILKQET